MPDGGVWARAVLVREGVLVALGAALVTLGWWGASGAAQVGTQVRWTALAGSGLILTALAHALSFLTARRAIGRRRRDVARRLDGLVPRQSPLRGDVLAAAPELDVVVVPGATTFFHRSSCPLVAGKEARPLGAAGRRATERSACPVCDAPRVRPPA